MIRIKKEYKITLDWFDEDNLFGQYGYLQKSTEGYFIPTVEFQGVYHDLFEHWFEKTQFFPSDAFYVCGEAVAIGIRERLIKEDLIHHFLFYEKPNLTVFDNAVNFVKHQVLNYFYSESFDDFSLFPEKKIKYPRIELCSYDSKIDFCSELKKRKFADYNSINKKLNRYFDYGYNLGDFMFGGIRTERFLNLFSTFKEVYQSFTHNQDFHFDFITFENSLFPVIYIKVKGFGIAIKPNSSVPKIISKINNLYYG